MTIPMGISLFSHQEKAIELLRTGSILHGGVGSGKTRTSIAYFYEKEFKGGETPKDLYVITTAAKRDTLDWERECSKFAISKDRSSSLGNIQLTVDSWNNIKKYTEVKDAFFIFDEQRVVGYGVWTKSFIKITRKNNWILLTATPGDAWKDYIPVFMANGFYRNKTDFYSEHVVLKPYVHYQAIEQYIGESKLNKLRDQITVRMDYQKIAKRKHEVIPVEYNREKFKLVKDIRWNIYEDEPIKQVGELFFTMRKVVNSDPSRLKAVKELMLIHTKLIVFYNFNYELDILRLLKEEDKYEIAEYNGHRHDPLPNSNSWVYLVQYLSGSEGWNCIETNAIVFYSQNYSYRMMIQAAGRIDRINTSFDSLYYYHLLSDSFIDKAIRKALRNKKNFNETEALKGEENGKEESSAS